MSALGLQFNLVGGRRRGAIGRLTTIAAAALGVLALAPAAASADTIVVNTTADEFGEGARCGLREAVQTANTNANFGGCVRTEPSADDTILLPPGAYFLTRQGAGEDNNETGDLDVRNGNLTIEAETLPRPVISAAGSDRAIDVPPGAGGVRLEISDLSITNGNASGVGEDGGAIRIGDPGGRLVVVGSDISNSSAADYGGAISIENSSSNAPLQITDSELVGNTAADHGGAVYLTTVPSGAIPSAVINRTTLTENSTAVAGGAVYIAGQFEDELRFQLLNSTVTGNSAAQGGGGIGMAASAAPAEIHVDFSTIASNTTPMAGRGGGIQVNSNEHRVFLRATIVAHNTANGAPVNCAKAPPGDFEVEHQGGYPNYNLESADTCDLDPDAPHNDLINTDPLLAPLAQNGGPTRTRGLFDGSPALGRVPVIPDDFCAPSGGIDQRGISRVAGEVPPFCDVGAFEGSVGPVPPPPPPPPPPPTPVVTPLITPTTTPAPTFDLAAAIKRCKKKLPKGKKRKNCIKKAKKKPKSA